MLSRPGSMPSIWPQEAKKNLMIKGAARGQAFRHCSPVDVARAQAGQALRHCSPVPEARAQAGQAMPEFALMIPIMTLLVFGLVFAGFYAFRATAADWGIFITGVAEGSYNTPATSMARGTILWPDIQEAVATNQDAPRSVRSTISIEKTTPWAFGITLIEAHKGITVFRLWRFYPGPPPPGGFE